MMKLNFAHSQRILFFALAVLLCQPLGAQTGPGGVGNTSSNFLWLKADAGTSTTTDGSPIVQWNDQSGNGNNVSQTNALWRPVFESGIAGTMNGRPLIEFDNDATNFDYLSVNDNATLDGFTGFSSFAAVRYKNGAASGTPRAIYSKRVDPSTSYCYSMFLYTSNRMYFDINSSGSGRMNSTSTFSTLTDYIVGGTFDPALSSNEQKIYTGASTLDGQQSNSGTSINNNGSSLHIGTLYGHTGSTRQFDGYIGEVIMFNRVVNDAEMRVINNYLSAKYNIAMASNDFYAGDNPANGDFDMEVAGIGQTAAAHTHLLYSPSASAGMGIGYVSGFQDGDYLFAGHNLAVNANINTDIAVVSGGPIDRRWQRIWYIDVTNAGAAISTNITFDLSDGGFPSLTAGVVTNYKLLYRATNSGNWTIVATASGVSGDQVIFNGYSFAGNAQDGYYTIGTLNNSLSPLPIQLLSFDASLNAKQVDLTWTTASETNNDYFTIERSADGYNWTVVDKVKGAGNSNQYTSYFTTDTEPHYGLSYYRLKQTDFDHTHSYSEIVAVNNTGAGNVTVFPNPASGTSVNLLFTGFSRQDVRVAIHDMAGRQVYAHTYAVQDGNSSLSLNRQLGAGAYLVTITYGSTAISQKLVVN